MKTIKLALLTIVLCIASFSHVSHAQVITTNVTDSALTPGTGPICPNGAGGLLVNIGCATGTGTVTSVILTTPSWLTGGGTVTTSGTFALAPATGQTSHQVIGTCGSGTTFAPCSLVAGDLPAVTNIAGGALGSLPCQSAAGTTTFVTSPTTTGNIFFDSWSPSGSAVACASYNATTNMPFLGSANNFTQPQSITMSNPSYLFSNTASGTQNFYIGTYAPNCLGQFSYNRVVSTGVIPNSGLPSAYINVGGCSGPSQITFAVGSGNNSQPGQAMAIYSNGVEIGGAGSVSHCFEVGANQASISCTGIGVFAPSSTVNGSLICTAAAVTGCPLASVSNLITSATGDPGTGTVTCITATCTNLRGSYSVAGGTFTTGDFLDLVWPTTTTAYVCIVSENSGLTNHGLYHSQATATGISIEAAVSIIGVTVGFDYSCQP